MLNFLHSVNIYFKITPVDIFQISLDFVYTFSIFEGINRRAKSQIIRAL